jgi:MFS family permease
MLYLADVAGSVAALMSFVAAMVGILGLAVLSASAIASGAAGEDTSHIWPWARRIFFVIAPCALIAVLIPSQNTIYAIAASEMGETALKTETGGKAMRALNAWLDRQIDGEGEPE